MHNSHSDTVSFSSDLANPFDEADPDPDLHLSGLSSPGLSSPGLSSPSFATMETGKRNVVPPLSLDDNQGMFDEASGEQGDTDE